MNELVPDWIKKRPFLWPVYGYAIAGWLILQMVDIAVPLYSEGGADYGELGLTLDFLGYFPAAAWSYWIYKTEKETKGQDRWKTPGPPQSR